MGQRRDRDYPYEKPLIVSNSCLDADGGDRQSFLHSSSQGNDRQQGNLAQMALEMVAGHRQPYQNTAVNGGPAGQHTYIDQVISDKTTEKPDMA